MALTDMPRFDHETERRLLRAGWQPARDVWNQVKLPKKIPLVASARPILTEFGNLEFKEPHGFTRLDPSIGDEMADELIQYQVELGHSLFPLGLVEGGDSLYLLVDDRGIIYTLAGEIEPLASSFEHALRYLVHVLRVNQRELREDLEAIGMFRKKWKTKQIGKNKRDSSGSVSIP